jgi:hypothetical protein
MAWRLGIGNLIARATASGAAAGSYASGLYPLSNLGNGYPDEPARWLFETDGGYSATFDLNLLATSSARSDAPTGWADLALKHAGTPGLPANPPENGTFAGRPNSVKFYGACYQDVEVMPGEDVRFTGGLYRPSASSATGARVVIVNLSNGKQWDSTANVWNNSTDPAGAQAIDDVWLDVNESVVNDSDERTTYRVILVPDGGPGAAFYCYASAPAITGEQNFVAFVGNNIPAGATVTWTDGTVTATPTPTFPSFFKTFTASSLRSWTLSITQPANSLPYEAAPMIGELWAGRLVDMVACPGYPFDILEGDPAQIRLEGGLGHTSIFTEIERPARRFSIKFNTSTDAQYENARDSFLRASRFGADPIMLAPVASLEGADTIWHGRLGGATTYSRISNARRSFTIEMFESSWPRFR